MALVVDDFDPSLGGYGAQAGQTGRLLAEDGHDVHLFSRSCGQKAAWMTFHQIRAPRKPRSLRELFFARECRKQIGRARYDIVMGFGRCLGANVVRVGGGAHRAWLEGDLLSYPSPFARAAKRAWRSVSPRTHVINYLEKKGYGSKDDPVLVAVSGLVGGGLVKHLGVPAERVKVIYNGVEIERFSPAQRDEHCALVRAEYGLGGELLVLFVANNFRLKGLGPLVRALDLLVREGSGPKLKAIIVGKGESRPYMEIARKGGWGKDLIFTGPRADVQRYYAAADIFVYPTFYDPCANVCMEALASGLPVITTRYNGVGEIVERARCGFVIDDPWDSEDLAAKIRYFFDGHRRAEASVEARRLAENFSIEKQYAELKKLLLSIASAAGSGGLSGAPGGLEKRNGFLLT